MSAAGCHCFDLNESTDEDTIEMTIKNKDVLKHDTIELAANQMYDRSTIFFNNDRKRFGIQGGKPIIVVYQLRHL